MAKQVRLRRLAAVDIEEALAYYRSHAPEGVATRFVDEVERAVQRIARRPHVGSLRFAFEVGVPDVRCVTLAKFPHAVFYVEPDEDIDVWRVLHTRRDIPGAQSEADD